MNYTHFDLQDMQPMFDLLERCETIQQGLDYHPEGNVLNHSLQTFKVALRESDDIDLLLAALLHDIGKFENSLGHEKIAMELLFDYCSPKTLWLIQHHMRIWGLILGNMRRQGKIDYLINHCWLPELICLARWDKMGRNPKVNIGLDRQRIIDALNRKVDKRWDVPRKKSDLPKEPGYLGDVNGLGCDPDTI